MARSKTSPFDKKVDELRRIREDRPAHARQLLLPLLSDKSHYVASEAAKLVGELEVLALAPELEALFRRVHDGEQPDRGCAVAYESIAALATLKVRARHLYLLGLRMVRREPDGTAFVDVATRVRTISADALLDGDGDRTLFDVLPLFADPEPDVRAGFAKVLGNHGTDAAVAAVYTKLLAGDRDVDVNGACFVALMHADARRFMPIVSAYLDEDNDDLAQLAALALAEVPVTGAFEKLRAAIEGFGRTRRGRTLYLALALLRSDEAERYLLHAVAKAHEVEAEHALHALEVHRHRPEITQQVLAAVGARKSERLRKAARQFTAPA